VFSTVVLLGACASHSKPSFDAASAPTPPDAGEQGARSAEPAPPAHPFAGSAAEATQLISAAVDTKSAEMQSCVASYRARKKLPHERVTFQLGIDQEGRLLGATLPKGKADSTLTECVQKALLAAPFPKSHAGVISMTKTYEEILQ
jgi:hypothetical protein